MTAAAARAGGGARPQSKLLGGRLRLSPDPFSHKRKNWTGGDRWKVMGEMAMGGMNAKNIADNAHPVARAQP
jgi:hypothetical protein